MNLLLLCASQWGRLDGYLEEEDRQDIARSVARHYRTGNVSIAYSIYWGLKRLFLTH